MILNITTMNNSYQNQTGALPLSSFAPYLTNLTNTAQDIGNAVSNFVQSAENKLSQCFWDGIGSLPKNYFSKDITNANYFDKSLWEGIFNERIEGLQEQLLSELQEQQTDDVQQLRGAGFPHVDKLREQMAAGLPHHAKPSLKEQLTALQGLVGKHTLSPQDYEAGLDALKEAASDHGHHTALIEQVRAAFRSKLKKEQGLLEECLQGDLLHLFKETPEKSLTPAPLNKVLRYYKPLMQHKTYAKQKEWVEQCYNKQTLLPLPPVNKQATKSSPAEVSSRIEGQQDSPTWGRSIRNWGRFLWENSGTLITFGLATQAAAVQASGANSTGNFMPEGNLTDGFPLFPGTNSFNQSFLMSVPVGATTEPNLFDKALAVPVNVTASAGPNHRYQLEISEKLSQEILTQFDKVNADLQDLITLFSTNENDSSVSQEPSGLRQKRAASRGERPKCKDLSQDLLVDLKNRIKATLNNTSQGEGSTDCTFDNNNSENCDELFKLIQCGVNHLEVGFNQAKANSASLHEVRKLKNQSDGLSRAVENVNGVLKNTEDEQTQKRLDDLNTDIQTLQKKVNNLEGGLKIKTIDHCISEIGSGKIDSAVGEFKKLKDDSNLYKIVQSVYRSYGKLNQTSHIVDFIQKLPGCPQDAIAYPVLFKEMRNDKHLTSPEVLIVFEAVKQCMRDSSLDKDLEKYVSQVIDAWAYKIRSRGDTAQIKDFAGKHFDDFRPRLPDLIKKAYANNLGNAENIIQFVRDLHYIPDAAIAYSSLFNEMQSNGHLDSYQLLMLAYRVKELMKMRDYPNVSQDNKKKLTTLEGALEPYVKGLLDSWANSIRSGGDTAQIKDFAGKHSADFRSRLPHLIEKAYANNLGNAENITQFVGNLHYIPNAAIAYSSLFNEMESNGHLNSYQLLMLAYRVKELMKMSKYPNIGQDYKDKFKKLEESLPLSVRDLIWNGNKCTIRNMYWNEYLYVPDSIVFAYYIRRTPFTWRYSTWGPSFSGTDGIWKFEAKDNAKFFAIAGSNGYLYPGSSGYAYDGDRRRVFSESIDDIESGRKDSRYWTLEPVDDKFKIKNTFDRISGEYLYAAEHSPYDSQRRRVLTWIPGDAEDDANWEIKCG
ncbi:MAG TPA: hypothetical protein VK133_00715 [Amoebophilaceae bacterium]|nr:hypothetical protein [Amoebophilaceae bacterium]